MSKRKYSPTRWNGVKVIKTKNVFPVFFHFTFVSCRTVDIQQLKVVFWFYLIDRDGSLIFVADGGGQSRWGTEVAPYRYCCRWRRLPPLPSPAPHIAIVWQLILSNINNLDYLCPIECPNDHGRSASPCSHNVFWLRILLVSCRGKFFTSQTRFRCKRKNLLSNDINGFSSSR